MLKQLSLFFFIVISFSSIAQYPVNTFTITSEASCVGETITFTSTSTPGSTGLAITKEKWDFGDGVVTELNGANNSITHTYTSSGTFSVYFYATNSNGTTPVAFTIDITVNPNPAVNFIASATNCSLPVTANITNSSSNGNYTYDWDFGNGQTSSAYSPTGIAYDIANTYPISLTVTNGATGCSSTLSKNIVINDFTADFSLSADSICQNGTLTLTDLSAGATSWTWNNGSNSSSNNQNPIFTYNTAGTFTITLTASNTSNGCSDQQTKTVVVVPKPTISIVANPSIGCSPLDVTFTNNSTNGTNFTWDFGDGSSIYTGLTPPLHTYAADGNYVVTVNASNDFGCTQQSTSTIIQVTPPVANFSSAVVDGCSPIDVQFNDLSTVPNPTDDPIVSWSWDFGNGNTSSSQSPSVETYVTGKYDVSLTITTQNGCTSTQFLSEYIKVGEIDSVGFSNTPDTSCAKSSVNFTDLTSILVPFDPSEIIYEWNFGDSAPGTSSQKDPTYSYPSDTGSFDVTLTVTFRGCVETYVKDSAVFIWSPISLFTVDNVCDPNSFPVQVDVTDQSTIGRNGDDVEMIYRWGDPLTSITNYSSPSFDSNNDQWSSSFNYNDYGTYSIKQVVYNNTTGCKDSTTNSITISRVDAGFTLASDSICLGDIVTLTDTSSSVIGAIANLSYDMIENSINGNVLSTTNYTYQTSGLFNIILTATDASGCTGTAQQQVYVLSLPVADITADDLTPCAPQDIVFINNSSFSGAVHGSSIVASNWILPNNSTVDNINENVPFTISTQGNFLTSLQVTDDFGCVSVRDTLILSVTKPVAAFATPSTFCNNETFIINELSSGISNEWTIDNVLVSNEDNLTYEFNESTSISSTTHKLTLITTDINGCQDSVSATISVAIPHANLTYILTGDNQSAANVYSCPPVEINATGINNSTSNYAYNWAFGNGNSALQQSPSATYYEPGTYTLTLSVMDQFGCTDDTSLVDYLYIGGPKATPIVTPPIDICKNLFIFSVQDTSEIASYYWDFGDLSNSTLDSIAHGYPIAGTYYPSLTVYDKENCSVKYDADIITVLNELTAKHTANPNPGITNEPVTFSDQSIYKDSIVSWYWEFGDFNNTDNLSEDNSNQKFSYKYPYTYTSVLTVIDKFGCQSSDTVLVKISGAFQTANVFTPNGDGVNDIFQFDVDIFEAYDVLVLNRWGNIVYDKKGVTGTYIWNGTHNDGNECTDGVYFFKVVGTIKDKTPFEASGYVTKIKG